MITGATHPLLVGKPNVEPQGEPRGATQGVPAPAGLDEVSIKESYTPLFPSLLTSSRWVSSNSDGKAVLIVLLALKDKNGFVWASVPGIAVQAGVSVEVARKVIETLKSPDPDSKNKKNDGRTIAEVEGGFLFLNNSGFLERAKKRTSPAPSAEAEGGKISKGGESEMEKGNGERPCNSIQYNSETFRGRTTYEKPLNPTSKYPSKQALNSWHIAELAEFSALNGDAEKKLLVIARGFAELAASKGEPTFPLATSYIAKTLNISIQRAGKIRSSLARKGIIVEADPYSREESKSARYRWALETTLPIPPMPSFEQDDPDEEPLF